MFLVSLYTCYYISFGHCYTNKNCMQIPTGGTVSVNVILNLTLICHIQPLKMVRISTPRAPLSELDQCSHHKCCVHELQTTRSMLSAGAEDADILFEDELSEERKEKIYSMMQESLLTFH